jgi:hypothetical protein
MSQKKKKKPLLPYIIYVRYFGYSNKTNTMGWSVSFRKKMGRRHLGHENQWEPSPRGEEFEVTVWALQGWAGAAMSVHKAHLVGKLQSSLTM